MSDNKTLSASAEMEALFTRAEELQKLVSNYREAFHEMHTRLGESERARAAAEKLADAWKNLAATHELTGLPNRRAFEFRVRQEVARTRRRGESLAIALLDLDNFKLVNDTYGHSTGDVVLQEFGDALTKRVRVEDFCAHIHGDEFLIILTGTSEDAARARVTQIATSVEKDVQKAFEGRCNVPLKVSAGVVELREDEELQHFLQRVDLEMYGNKALRKGS